MMVHKNQNVIALTFFYIYFYKVISFWKVNLALEYFMLGVNVIFFYNKRNFLITKCIYL